MIEIFGLRLSGEIEKTKFDRLLQFTGVEKQAKIKRFLRFRDAQRALFADILIRYVICEKLKMENEEIKFEKNSYGKPFLENSEGFHFNLSHSHEWIVCALDNLPIGVDIEAVKPIEMDIAKRFFSSEEYGDIISLEEPNRLPRFFELWTLKESYIKAWGKGLSIPLDSFTIRINRTDISVDTENEFKRCFFKQYNLDRDYKMAVCAQNNEFPDNVFIKTSYELFDYFNNL